MSESKVNSKAVNPSAEGELSEEELEGATGGAAICSVNSQSAAQSLQARKKLDVKKNVTDTQFL